MQICCTQPIEQFRIGFLCEIYTHKHATRTFKETNAICEHCAKANKLMTLVNNKKQYTLQ